MLQSAISSEKSAVIVGIDEVGRGALAGPVVAAAVALNPILKESDRAFITDSKKLSEVQREEAYIWICDYCAYGIGSASAEDVDELGILGATEKAMNVALTELEKHVTPTYLLVDGRDKFWFNYPHSSVIKGDVKEVCIAAASILAKVTRDREMIELEEEFPHFNFAVHKGYGVPEHYAALEMHGPCSLHRKTFLKEE